MARCPTTSQAIRRPLEFGQQPAYAILKLPWWPPQCCCLSSPQPAFHLSSSTQVGKCKAIIHWHIISTGHQALGLPHCELVSGHDVSYLSTHENLGSSVSPFALQNAMVWHWPENEVDAIVVTGEGALLKVFYKACFACQHV